MVESPEGGEGMPLSRPLVRAAIGIVVVASLVGIVLRVPGGAWRDSEWAAAPLVYGLVLVGIAVASVRRFQGLITLGLGLIGGLFSMASWFFADERTWHVEPASQWAPEAMRIGIISLVYLILLFLLVALYLVVRGRRVVHRVEVAWLQLVVAALAIAAVQFEWIVAVYYY